MSTNSLALQTPEATVRELTSLANPAPCLRATHHRLRSTHRKHTSAGAAAVRRSSIGCRALQEQWLKGTVSSGRASRRQRKRG
jgi:hypothetical protein